MASPSKAPQLTPVNGLGSSSVADERNQLLQAGDAKVTSGYDSGKDFFSSRNVLLGICLLVGLVGFALLFLPQVGTLLGLPECRRHVDHYMGRTWIECPEAIQPKYGPRRF